MTAAARVDVAAWRASLCSPEPPAWLGDALGDPAGFWRRAAPALSAAVAGGSRSTLFERYQLAHDFAARHTAPRAPGFAAHGTTGWVETGYADLVAQATALAAAWRARGVVAGTCVAIVAPISVDLVVALIAAWQLGAIAAPIPVWGRTYIVDRVAAVAADVVAATRPCARWLALAPERQVALRADPGALPGGAVAHPYAPDEPALRVCSPLGDEPLTAVDVPAERLYLGALRDGVVFFALGAGLGLAAPGLCDAQHGLPLVTACLATGACFVAIELDAACRQPALVAGDRVHALGVHPRLRDALVASDARALGRAPARWFRSATTAHEPARWAGLAALRPFARALGACYVASPVTGGAITWSTWRQAPALNTALPAPGLDWQIVEPGQRGAPAVDGNGILTTTAATAAVLGAPLLGRIAGESLWIASLGAHRDGQRVPACEIEDLARRRREVWAAAVIDDARIGAVLVVFTDPARVAASDLPARDALGHELGELIGRELAPHLVPARIVVVGVAPRFSADGALDVAWCSGQYTSGRFAAKQREPVFATLARLRRALEP